MPYFDVSVNFTGVMSKNINAKDKLEAVKKMQMQVEESIGDVDITDVQFNNGDMQVTETKEPPHIK